MRNTARSIERFGAWLPTRVVEFQADLCRTWVLLTPFFQPLFLFVEHTVDRIDDVYRATGIRLHCCRRQGLYQRSSFSPWQGEYLDGALIPQAKCFFAQRSEILGNR